ncbi:hypothetical protein B7463_g9471, partial [Scytalidium lignicola]
MYALRSVASRKCLHSSQRLIAPRYSSRPFSGSIAGMTAISDAIKKDHQELKDYYNNIVNSAEDHAVATRWQNQFTWELARHSIAEELVVYPAFEKNLGQKGKEIADKDLLEHQKVNKDLLCTTSTDVNLPLTGITIHTQVKEKLHKFQSLKASSLEFLSTLQSLMKDLRQHMDEEETDDLVALDNSLQSGETESMAKSFERTKMFTPTRSHPSAPDKPPFETVLDLMTVPIDKLGDILGRRFPDQHTK